MFPLHLWGLVSLFVHQPAHHHLPLSSYFPCLPPLTTSASHPAALMSFLRGFWHVVLMNCTHTLSLSSLFSLSLPHFVLHSSFPASLLKHARQEYTRRHLHNYKYMPLHFICFPLPLSAGGVSHGHAVWIQFLNCLFWENVMWLFISWVQVWSVCKCFADQQGL